jgi:hypothetical protein
MLLFLVVGAAADPTQSVLKATNKKEKLNSWIFLKYFKKFPDSP